ncbi:MAG: hypothetical protein HRU81_09390 [Gammaproteobacteria bacterium]|nr:MAG: hypothetical protein HRU81_09390 [Gammaproteobacteria bacterium]
MPALSLNALRIRSIAGRRVWALALLAWLGVIAQPCLAAQAPQAMSHCHHAGGAEHAAPMAGMPCHTMVAADCGHDGALATAGLAMPAATFQHAGFTMADAGRLALRTGEAAPRGGTGPPAHILFCSLSN